MKSAEMLDVLQRSFKEVDFFHDRPNPDIVCFFESIGGRIFKGQALAKDEEFIRVELWLNLGFSQIDYNQMRAGIKSVNDRLKNASEANQWIAYGVNEEKHHLGIFMDIKADKGSVGIEQCNEWYQKMVSHVASHLMLILP
ncbi:MAG: hypothetical protein WC587_00005 [Candidatus Paceibacterota bacterium]